MRLSRHGFTVALVALAATVAGLSAQQVTITTTGGPGLANLPGLTPTPPKPLEAGTGLIYGQAVDGLTTRPVSGALVTLTVAGSVPVRVLADGEGHWAFRDVPKGGFSISATKPGFADGAYGRLRPNGPTQALQLTDGQRVTDVVLPLWKLATLAGTVVDEGGEPIVGAVVRVLQRTIAGGKRQWQLGATTTTDDRGMYRLGGLVAGDYAVVLPMTPPTTIKAALAGLGLPDLPGAPGGRGGGAVQAAFSLAGGGASMNIQSFDSGAGLGPAGVTPDGHELWYQTEFYPSALSSTHADVITVKSGEERGSVDFTIKPVPTYLVSGTLLGPTGPSTDTALSIVPAEAGDLVTPIQTATAVTDGTGHFEFTRVPSGQYTLRAVKTPRGTLPGGDTQTFQVGGNTMVIRTMTITSDAVVPPLPTDPTLWIETTVGVGATDLTDLAVTLKSGVKVSGRIEFNGAATQPTPDQYPTIGVSLVPADGRPNANPARGRIEPTGLFTTVGVPAGKYVLRVNAPNGWLVRSAVVNGRDLVDGAADLREDLDGVVITFTDKQTGVTGSVTSAAGSVDPKATVILYPQDPSLWVDSGPTPRRLRSTRTNADGSFSMSMPAGDYYLVAVSDTGTSEWNDPQLLANLTSVATKISVNEGEKRPQTLRTVAPATNGGGRP